MRKRLFPLFVLALTWLVAAVAPAQAQSGVAPNTVLVQFSPFMTITAQSRLIRALGLTWTSVINRGIWVVRVPAGWSPGALVSALMTNPNVAYAETNATFTACMDPPNDTVFNQQWNLAPWGPTAFGVNALSAWGVTLGSGVNVAVLDTGLAFEDQPPFALAPDIDPARVVLLSDWVHKTTSPDDDNGHGTFLCSVIGETINNSLAGVGVAPMCTLMAGKVLNATGVGTADQVANGIYEAVNRGAQVILLAAVSQVHSRTVQDAIDYAASGQIQVICPTGNNLPGLDLDANPGAVAFYGNTIVVSALDRSGKLATYSNFGSRVDLSAPGGDFPFPVLAQSFPSLGAFIGGDTVVQGTGTSIAAAHVAGVLALAISVGRGLDQVKATAHRPAGPGHSKIYGWGAVDAGAVVGGHAVVPPPTGNPSGTPTPPVPVTPTVTYDVAVTQMHVTDTNNYIGHPTSVIVTAANNGSGADQFTVQLFDDTTGTTIGSQSVSLNSGATSDLTFPWTIAAPAGTHHLRAVAVPTHTPETNTNNNQVTLDTSVTSAPLTLNVESYAPNFSDNTVGPATTTFRVGFPIGLRFVVTDGGQPVSGQPVHFSLRGATGAVVMDLTVTTDATGTATSFIARYSQMGGTGIYTATCSTTRDTRTATGLTFFVVTPLSRSMN